VSRASIAILASLIYSFGLQAATHSSALFSKLPLLFEKNEGQPSARLRYFARGTGFELALDSTHNQITFNGQGNAEVVLNTRFVGARSKATIEALDPSPARTSYFVGNQPDHWHADVTNFGKIRVNEIYRGVDLVFYGTGGTLEYDFVVQPGADLSSIRFEIDGAQSLRVGPSGDLVLSTKASELRWKSPVLYQELNGKRIEIEGGFELHGRSVSFRAGEYDHTRRLVIDPVLKYATFLGGDSNQAARAIGMDAAGNIYVAGGTSSPNLPVTKGVIQVAYGGGQTDAFVAKLNPAGQLQYLTYLGGGGNDAALDVAVDSSGNAYVTGGTTSANFPTTAGVLQPKFGGFGGNSCFTFGDAFVTKLNPSGTQMVYSTYLGGVQDDFGTAVTVDSAGNAYVAGSTISPNFPITPGAYQTKFGGRGGQVGRPFCGGAPAFSGGDAFIAKINPTGSSLVFSTYLGGTLDDMANSIALDSQQNVYVGGATISMDFPTSAGAFQTAFHGSESQNQFFQSGDGFVTKLNSKGSALMYSTYLGGTGDDVVASLVVDSTGTAYITGSTSSQNFPVTSNAVQHSYGGYFSLPFLVEQLVGDAFVTRLNATGTALLYSTYYGGAQNDSGMGINVDSSGLIYLVGATDSSNFPITANATQKTFGGGGGQFTYYQTGDGFLAVIDPNSTKAVFSTFYGGNLDDGFGSAVLDGKGSIWLTGNTVSPNLPVTSNALQTTFSGGGPMNAIGGDAIVVQYSGFTSTNSLVNAASFANAPVAPGSLITVFGTFPGVPTSSAANLPLPDSLGGISLTINGTPVPLDFVNASQINAQLPWASAPGPAVAAVSIGGTASASLQFTVGAASPGIFTFGTNRAVAQNHDYTLNDTGNPAAVGSYVVLYMTGGGAVSPVIPTGAASPASPLSYLTAQVSATIGGQPAEVLFAGMAPYFVGVVQANVKIPPLSSGDYPVVVAIGGVQSNAPLVSVSNN